jgi:hypothetical protein
VASLTKRPNSRFWVACFTDRTGRRLKRSTGETDRKAAKDIAHSYELAAQKLKTSRQVRRVISDLHRAITGEALTSQTFPWLLQALAGAQETIAQVVQLRSL